MNKKQIFGFSAILLVLIAGLYVLVLKPQLDNRTVPVVTDVTISNTEIGLDYKYPSGEKGYTLIEPPIASSTDAIKKIFLIMSTEEYIAYQTTNAQRETPPTVSIFVFTADAVPVTATPSGRVEQLRAWIREYPQYSSFSLATTSPEVVELDGLKLLTYQTNGQYKQVVYVTTYGDNTYVFTGQFREVGDPIYNMFANLMQSVSFN